MCVCERERETREKEEREGACTPIANVKDDEGRCGSEREREEIDKRQSERDSACASSGCQSR